jgi:methyl-accepting chemotaxis protein
MNKTDNATRQVQRSLTKAIVLRNATPLLAAWLFIWGTAVLALRITIEPPSLWFAYGIAGIPAALLIAAIQARRQIPDSTAIRAKLDAINHDGGMLMASAETNLPEWKENIVISHLPTAHWRNLPSPAVLIAAIVFIAASIVMPIPHNIIPGDNAMAINDLIDDFQAKIDILDEEELIDEARAESLRESLSKISEDADGDDPIRTWEALDNVADSINDISDQAAAELEKLSENAAAMQSATENIRQSMQNNGNTTQLSQAMQELASLMESKNLLNAMNGDIPPELAQALKTAKLSP